MWHIERPIDDSNFYFQFYLGTFKKQNTFLTRTYFSICIKNNFPWVTCRTLTSTLFTFSILPPLKFIKTLFFLQTSLKRVRLHSKMIPTNYFILVFSIFLENGAKFENLQKSRINQSFIIYSRI